jgi:hypothetical protein
MAAIMTFGDKLLGARIRTAQPSPKGWLVESPVSHLGHCRHCPALATLGVLVLKMLRRHGNALATLDPFRNSANVD